MYKMRPELKYILKQAGILPTAHTIRQWLKLLVDLEFRLLDKEHKEEFLKFKRQHGSILQHRQGITDYEHKRVLIVSLGPIDNAKVEMCLIKALGFAGFMPIVLLKRDKWLAKYYKLANNVKLLFWDEFTDTIDYKAAGAIVERLQSFEDLLAFEYDGIRVGKSAASKTLRILRTGSIDLRSTEIRRHLVQCIASGMMFAAAARRIISEFNPQKMLCQDKGYTPQAELFDICLAEGIDVMTWSAAHRNNALMLKRYTLENRDEHYASLSEETWQWLCSIPWTDEYRRSLYNELYSTYASGDWYGVKGTQFNTQVMDVAEIRQCLGLDSAKKTAVIFSHILWDGTFFWGIDLFSNYEEWFIETVRAACANDKVNWVIKIHPANVTKNVRDGIQGEPSEITAIRKHVGQLPSHVYLIPADSRINTFSLFELMDYCLTVRGTIGIEAANFGIPVLTAGTGRFDHKGFTIDSGSREEYFDNLSSIQDIPPLSPEKRELAERFAYGIFLMRPLPLTTITLEYQKDAMATNKIRINARNREDWLNAPDLSAFVKWIADSHQLDFLNKSLNLY